MIYGSQYKVNEVFNNKKFLFFDMDVKCSFQYDIQEKKLFNTSERVKFDFSKYILTTLCHMYHTKYIKLPTILIEIYF